MAITNPTKYVTIRRLERFKAKLDQEERSAVSNVAYDGTNKKITKTKGGTTSDVVSVATLKTDMNLGKSDVGLGNVGNFKAVSTEASQGLSSTEQANARTNIGAAPSSTTYTKTEVDNKIADCERKYMLSVAGTMLVFAASPAVVVSGTKLMLG